MSCKIQLVMSCRLSVFRRSAVCARADACVSHKVHACSTSVPLCRARPWPTGGDGVGGWRRCRTRDGGRRWPPSVLLPKPMARRAVAGRRCRERIDPDLSQHNIARRCYLYGLGVLPCSAACILLDESVRCISVLWHNCMNGGWLWLVEVTQLKYACFTSVVPAF